MDDQFASYPPQVTDPPTRHYLVTSAMFDEPLPVRPRRFVVNTDGVAVIRDEAGVDITYNVIAGGEILGRWSQVRTGTTAELIAQY